MIAVQPSMLKQTERIWDRNVKSARTSYVLALKARFANPCAETERLVEQTRAGLESAVAQMREDERRAERVCATACRSAK